MATRDAKRLIWTSSIIEVVAALGLSPPPRCPFGNHDGFAINATTQTWRCSSCGLDGNTLDLVVRVLGVSRRHARELLRAGPGSLRPPSTMGPIKGDRPEVSTRRFLGFDIEADAADHDVLEQVVGFYHSTLMNSVEGLGYFDQRGITDRGIIERFQVGLSNRTLGFRLPAKNRKQGALVRGRLQKLGVYRDSGHEHLNGCIVVPIHDPKGRVVDIYGRKILGKRLRKGTPIHMRLPRPLGLVLWNVVALGDHDSIIICEGVLDGLSFAANGFGNVVAVLGPDAFAEGHVEMLKEAGVKKVTFAFDRDDDGERGAWSAAALLAPEGIEVFRVMFPSGMDANDLVRASEDPRQALADAVRNARWLGGDDPSVQVPAKVDDDIKVGPDTFELWMDRYLEWLLVRNYSDKTVAGRRVYLGMFIGWAHSVGLTKPIEVERRHLEGYQRFLFRKKKRNGKPLSARSQHTRLVAVRAWFKWLTRRNAIEFNPASELELPKIERRLPKAVLTITEAERVMAQPDLTEPLGVRDRAILETLWSTGIRRQEVIDLGVWDVDRERGTVMVRLGKGRRDRMVPIGDRAITWVTRYLEEVRPDLVVPPDEGEMFLSSEGGPLGPRRLTQLVGGYVEAAKLGKRGSCHLFRHTTATLMLEGGADIRFIQAMLGHVLLSTTQLYTAVSIRQLKLVHTATHPAATLDGPAPVDAHQGDDDVPTEEDLLGDLEAEGDEDEGDGE